jgi:hypothetical protein
LCLEMCTECTTSRFTCCITRWACCCVIQCGLQPCPGCEGPCA